MYCPQCAAQNESGQQYCRNCGQQLGTVLLALEGRIDQALSEYKSGTERLGRSLVPVTFFFIVFCFMLAVQGLWPFLAVLIAFIIIMSFRLIPGISRIKHANELLPRRNDPLKLISNVSGQTDKAIVEETSISALQSEGSYKPSITEHTTHDLRRKPPES
jgi:hypothetical protein